MIRWLAALIVVCVLLLPHGNAGAQLAQPSSLQGYWDGIVDDEDRVGPDDLRITRLTIDLKQNGGMVDATIEAVLSHRNQQRTDPIEAWLTLLLPEQGVLTGYALDVGGAMIPGVLLDQPKARRVYEAEVREGIDPGLAEVSGNRFSTRIYPIAPGSSRTVRIHVSAPVDAVEGFALPWPDVPVEAITLRYEGSNLTGSPTILFPWGESLIANYAGNRASKVDVTVPAKPAQSGALWIKGTELSDDLVIARHSSGQGFFEFASPGGTEAAAPPPGRLRVYWDRSWSRADDPLDAEIALLGAYLAARPATAIDLVSFAEDRPVVTSFADAAGLRAALAAQTYLGATRMTGLDELKLAAASQCLLFTDGARTLDPGADFAPDCRLQIVASAPDANTAYLTRLAQDSGGRLSLLKPGKGDTVLADLLRAGGGVIRVRDGAGRKIAFRNLSTSGGGWHIVGPMPKVEVLSIWVADADGQVTVTNYDRSTPRLFHDGAGALWAEMEVSRLADDPVEHDAMVALARKYQVASASLSFLVLESPDQYVDADIAPPLASFGAEWREEYARLRKEKDGGAKETLDEHLEMVRENWAERRQWWAKRFDAKAKAANGDDQDMMMAPPPPPPPAPPPPSGNIPAANAEARAAEPMASADAEENSGSDDGQEIVVTTASLPEPVDAVALVAAGNGAGGTVEIADLLSNAPYITAIAAAAPAKRDGVLREQAKLYGHLAGFWLDVAEWYRTKGDAAMAPRLLATALDAATADGETLQIVAFRFQRDGRIDDAIRLLERFAALNGERPQPRRLLALALAQRGKPQDLGRAFALLADVALTPFDSAFEGIEVVALMEANALIPRLDRARIAWKLAPEYVARLDTDVRIVIEWTNDDADIDLWVIEPNGERVYYSHELSAAGGTISNDMTDGYGPEEYVIRRARTGDYKVRIDGYSADRINPNGRGRVIVRLIRDFGRPTQKEQLVDAEIGFEDAGGDDQEGGRGIATLTFSRTSLDP